MAVEDGGAAASRGCHTSTGALVVVRISAMAVRRVSRRRARAESGPRGLVHDDEGALVVVIMRARARALSGLRLHAGTLVVVMRARQEERCLNKGMRGGGINAGWRLGGCAVGACVVAGVPCCCCWALGLSCRLTVCLAVISACQGKSIEVELKSARENSWCKSMTRLQNSWG
jgi:hypothetical protein